MGLSVLLRYSAALAALAIAGATGWRLRAGSAEGAAPATRVEASTPAPAVLEPASVPPAPAAPVATDSSADGERLAGIPAEKTSIADDPGGYVAPPIVVDGRPRVYPLSRNIWIRPTPSDEGSWIGFAWFGSSVPLRETEGRKARGCFGRWYAIEPRGYICVDDVRATLDPEHPTLVGITPYAPNTGRAWPHRYGESIDARRYVDLPTERKQRAEEWYYRSHLALVERARSGEVIESLLGIDLSLPEAGELAIPILPRHLQTDRDRLQGRSTVAWSREQLHTGRSFLLTADLKWVPKDRIKTYPPVTFQGVRLGRDAKLPLAFFRAKDRPSYRRAESGELVQQGDGFARLSWVELTGREEQVGEDRFLETRQEGSFVRERDAVIPRVAEKTPWGAALGSAESGRAERPRTWMEASILGGWLLAYEEHTPVFATLISAGRGGPPHGDIDPIETASTPLGRFKITGKFATATMVAPNDLTHSDVPWAQNFSGPHALHTAYWHDRWGELKSGGCLNVSPIDGRYLFYEFTWPRVPEGWHGVRWDPDFEPATTLIVRR